MCLGILAREGLRESPLEYSQSPPSGNQTRGGAGSPPRSRVFALAPGLRCRRRLRWGAWASGAEGVNRPRLGGARRGRKEIAVLLKVFFFFFFSFLSSFSPAEVSAGRRRR